MRRKCFCPDFHNDIPGSQIFALQATDDGVGTFGWQMLQLAKVQAQPQIIYTSSKADRGFLQKLEESYEGLDDEGSHVEIRPQVRLEKASIFTVEQV